MTTNKARSGTQPADGKRRQVLGLLGGLGLGAALPLHAQDRPIALILPVSAGSGVDTIIRATTEAWSREAGHTIVVENRPGAGGLVGTSALVKAAPDGYTLGAVSNNHVIFPSVYKSVPFDPIADITPISVLGQTPLLLVSSPKRLAAANVKELLAELKAKPGVYNFASSGNGTVLHLAAEMFNHQAGVQARHIPYKGSGPMGSALLAGEVDYGVLALPAIRGHIKSGAMRALGVCGDARIPDYPDLPTVAEQGLPGFSIEGWFAIVAPAGLPADKAEAVYRHVSTALKDPKVVESMRAQGNVIAPKTPAQSLAFMKAELAKFATAVKQAGVQLM